MMKKQVGPGLITVVIVLVVVGAAFFLWRAATDVPSYPGQNAGKPAAESAGGGGGSKSASVPSSPVSYDQAKQMRIPGMNPAAAQPPSAPSGH
jgi:hypothetical protein